MVWTDLTWSAERESSRSPYFSSVTIDRSGAWWTGTEASDLVDYLKEFTAAGYPAERVLQISCSGCGSDKFRVRLDDDEGCAVRTCTGCDTTSFVFDSEDFVEDADLGDAACPCGGEVFNVAAGFALHDDGDVRWVDLGLRCVLDGVLGCYADWQIDYSPTSHLFEQI